MHSNREFLLLQKRLIESQMIILDFQMRDVESQLKIEDEKVEKIEDEKEE